MDLRLTQNVIVSNANKSNIYDLSNDVILSFPPTLFYSAPKYLELLNADLNIEVNMFGNTNNTLFVIYEGAYYLIVLDYINFKIKTNEEFATCLESALNNPIDPLSSIDPKPYSNNNLTFKVVASSIEHVITNPNPERDATTTAFAIISTEICTLDFNHKDSVGSIIGFGNGLYENKKDFNGISTHSMTAYNYIDIVNVSGDNDVVYPEFGDINCKMVLFNSDNELILNKNKPNDTTISLNVGEQLMQYSTIGDVLKLIEDQLNTYSSSFTPAAVFEVNYITDLNKITIINTSGAKFGIGFNFNDIDEIGNTSGSLHYVLGFKQRNYYNIKSITSDQIPKIFDKQFTDDYVLICSDIIESSIDIGVIGIGNADNIKKNNTLFTIPISRISNFMPTNSSRYRICIATSKFSKSYSEKTYSLSNPHLINFYLRLISGRHITCTSQFTMLLAFIF